MRRRSVLQGLTAVAGLSLAPSGWGQTTAKPDRWLRIESPNFIVYSAIAQDKSRQEVEALERFHSLLLRLMPRGARPLAKLTVYIAATGKDFEQSAPTLSQYVGGFYQAGVEEIRAVVDVSDATGRQRNMARNVRADDARVVLFHEYAHHYTRTNTRVAYPPWYQEGIAEFLSTVQFTDNGYTLGQFTLNRAQWLTMGDWMGIEDFLGKDPHTMSDNETAQFYAQSWLATHLLCTRPERAVGFDRYCKALKAGGDPLGSFEGAFGITVAAFDNELKEYKRKSIGLWKIQEAPADISSSIYVTSLDVAANQILSRCHTCAHCHRRRRLSSPSI